MAIHNNATLIRRNLLSKTIRLFLEEQVEEMERIPIEMRPKDGDSIRCCIYKDRAVLKYKMMSVFGFSSEDETDELKPISSYFKDMIGQEKLTQSLLSVVDEACRTCQSGEYIVTNMCRGCVGRPCEMNCPKNCIEIKDGQAFIDNKTCVGCGLCQKVCPYHAIVYTPVPCEESCPVKAIGKNEKGLERINEEKCIYCGKCIEACPFGAVVERSAVYHVIRNMKAGKAVVAMVAPAIFGQFKAPMHNILEAIKKLGFTMGIEVAEGANLTTEHESEEWRHKMENGQPFMTTSCCPSYVNLVNGHLQELKPFVSDTPSPMAYTAEMARKEHPDATVVFIGPCLGKKHEAQKNDNIDYVINTEELEAWMDAAHLTIETDTVERKRNIATPDSRRYAITGGVAKAVSNCLGQQHPIKPMIIQGIDKESIRQLKMFVKRPVEHNFIEVMSCPNGCIGGGNNLAKPTVAKRQIENSVQEENKLEQ